MKQVWEKTGLTKLKFSYKKILDGIFSMLNKEIYKKYFVTK